MDKYESIRNFLTNRTRIEHLEESEQHQYNLIEALHTIIEGLERRVKALEDPCVLTNEEYQEQLKKGV